jgi:hypothetical protein
MKKLFLCLTVLALFAGAAARLRTDRPSPSPVIVTDASRDASAAFRDGLYLGKLAARQGNPMRVASGRWSTSDDRALFAVGYQQGYHESVASLAISGAVRPAN